MSAAGSVAWQVYVDGERSDGTEWRVLPSHTTSDSGSHLVARAAHARARACARTHARTQVQVPGTVHLQNVSSGLYLQVARAYTHAPQGESDACTQHAHTLARMHARMHKPCAHTLRAHKQA